MIEDLSGEDDVILWDEYSTSALREFLESASEILEYEFFNTALTKETVDSVIDKFKMLGEDERGLFLTIGCTRYFDGLEAYYHSVLSDNEELITLSTLILESEYMYAVYLESPDSREALDSFVSKTEEALNIYTSLSDKTRADEYLKPLIDRYKSIYDSLK